MLTLIAAIAVASQQTPKHSRVELLSEVRTYQAGKPFLVGLRFKIDPKWHIYWRNPGDSGQEPRVIWKLPKGWKASELSWPVPRVLTEEDITTYVYENTVILLAKVMPAGNGTATLRADVNWLVCSDVCLPERQSVTVRLGSGSGAPSPAAKALRQAEASLPKPAKGVVLAVTPSDEEFQMQTTLTGTEKLYFFPYQSTFIRNLQTQRYEVGTGGLVLSLPRSEYYGKGVSRVRGVLAGSRSGKPFAFEIDIPMGNRR